MTVQPRLLYPWQMSLSPGPGRRPAGRYRAGGLDRLLQLFEADGEFYVDSQAYVPREKIPVWKSPTPNVAEIRDGRS